MKIFALADLHLSLSCPNKDMSIYGLPWKDYQERIAQNWKIFIKAEDVILIPGDICWAMKEEEAKIDLEWVDQLPGKKIITKGNHDYWWPSKKKLEALLPSTISSAQNTLVEITPYIAVVGTRFWDSPEYSFIDLIDWKGDKAKKQAQEQIIDKAIYERELLRLEEALKLFREKHQKRLCMVHYPPLGADMAQSQASDLLEKYGVSDCVFGHLHSLYEDQKIFGTARGVNYHFVACDYLKCTPKLLFEAF